jgi:hypothetical protein
MLNFFPTKDKMVEEDNPDDTPYQCPVGLKRHCAGGRLRQHT